MTFQDLSKDAQDVIRRRLAAAIGDPLTEEEQAAETYDGLMDALAAAAKLPGSVITIQLPQVLTIPDMEALRDTLAGGRLTSSGRLMEVTGTSEDGAYIRIMAEVVEAAAIAA